MQSENANPIPVMKSLVFLIVLCLLFSACATSPRAPASGGAYPQTYRVQKGDSVSKIALKTGTSVSLLSRWNQLKPPYTIYPGQMLYLGDPSGLPKNHAGPKSVTIERVRSQQQDVPPHQW
jgi:lipoprotein NlpD